MYIPHYSANSSYGRTYVFSQHHGSTYLKRYSAGIIKVIVNATVADEDRMITVSRAPKATKMRVLKYGMSPSDTKYCTMGVSW